MTVRPSDEEIELELLRLSQSRAKQLQPRVAALRAILKSRQSKRREREQEAGPERVEAFAELDLLSDMARGAGMDVSARRGGWELDASAWAGA